MLIGSQGSIELQREWPAPIFVPDSQISRLASGNRLLIKADAWLDGQRVLISNVGGMPFTEPGQLYPPYPSALRFWGVPGEEPPSGPTSLHRGEGDTIFWYDTEDGDSEPFWESAATVGLVEQITVYINRDGLDRAAFYMTEEAALLQDPDQRLKFYAMKFGSMLLAPAPATPVPAYNAALLEEERKQPRSSTETELSPVPATIQAVYDDTTLRDWKYVGTVTSYQVETDARMLDTATIGQDFGDYQKGLITGAGNFNALFYRQFVGTNLDGRDLLRMMYMTNTGAKARIRLMLYNNREKTPNVSSVYLEGGILIGRGSLSVAADDIVRLQTDFVVTKDKTGKGLRPGFGSLD